MARKPDSPRIAWAMTGSGHYLLECIEIVESMHGVDLFLSKAAEEVVRMYDYDKRFRESGAHLFRDTTASAPPVALFYRGDYRSLIVAPATSNTVAKCVVGISDTLVTNVFAQAGKCKIPTIVFACDTKPVVETLAPGKMVTVYPRKIDLENVERLRGFERTQIVTDINGLHEVLETNSLWASMSSS